MAELLPTLLLVLAVGCGTPALIYIAFKGKPQSETRAHVEKPEAQAPPSEGQVNVQRKPEAAAQMQPPAKQNQPDLGYMEGYYPMIIKGRVMFCVPTETLLEMAKLARKLEEAEHAVAQAQPPEQAESPETKLDTRLFRRVGA